MMDYREFFAQDNEAVLERYELAMERVKAIGEERTVAAPFDRYFKKTGAFIQMIGELS